jgi:hypothetical protein
MQKRGQVAVEFLTTYGWAIMIIVIVVAVLAGIGVFNQQSVKPTCTASYPINCVDVKVDKVGAVELTFSANDVESAELKTITLTSTLSVACPPGVFGEPLTNEKSINENQGLKTCISNKNLKPGSVYEGVAEVSYKLKGGSEVHISKIKFLGNVEDTCKENWKCTKSGSCTNGIQNYNCIDLNNCGTELEKPVEQRSCCSVASCRKNPETNIQYNQYCDVGNQLWADCQLDSRCDLIDGICKNDAKICPSACVTYRGSELLCNGGWTCGEWSPCINNLKSQTCNTNPNCYLVESNQTINYQSCGNNPGSDPIFRARLCPSGWGKYVNGGSYSYTITGCVSSNYCYVRCLAQAA